MQGHQLLHHLAFRADAVERGVGAGRLAIAPERLTIRRFFGLPAWREHIETVNPSKEISVSVKIATCLGKATRVKYIKRVLFEIPRF